MSKAFGPYNATSTPAIAAGSVVGIPVNQDAAAVRISNQSLAFDLLISFATSQPPAVTQVANDHNWTVVLHPGDRQTITLQNADRTPTVMGQFWQGTVWILPLNTASQLAQTGGVPSLANVWLTTYVAGEPIPPTDPGPLAANTVGQPRVIAVPPSPQGMIAANQALTTGQDITLRTDGFLPGGPPTTGGNITVWVYLYWLYFTLSGLPASGDVAVNIALWADLMNGGVVVAGTPLFYGSAWANKTPSIISPIEFYPAVASVQQLIWPIAATTGLRWRLHVDSASANVNAWWSIGAGVDLVNNVSPGTHGNYTPATGLY